MTQKLYYTIYDSPETFQAAITAEFAGLSLELKKINKKYDCINLVTSKGVLSKPSAILRYLASDTPLNGTSKDQRIQVDNWYQYFHLELFPVLSELYGQILGEKPANQTKYTYSLAQINKILKVLDSSLKFQTFFIGNGLTVFDITLACYLENLFKLVMTQGQRKKLPNLFRWFKYVRSTPTFEKFLGKISLCGQTSFKINFSLKPEDKLQTLVKPFEQQPEKKLEQKSAQNTVQKKGESQKENISEQTKKE